MTLYHRVADIPTTESLLREACTLLHNVNATFVPSNDSANAMCVSLCQRITALIVELRAAGDAQPVASIYITPGGEREIDDWRHDFPAGRHTLYAAPAPAQPSSEMFAIVYEQANDDGLWFIAKTAPEAYLQQELRRLHAAIEAGPPAQPVTDAQPVAWRYRDYVSGCWFVSAEEYSAGSIAGESVPLYLAPAPAQPRQPLSEWIACSERLPEHDALRVIVYCTADRPENRMWCAIWNAGDQSFEADGGWFERDEITHWQPAPKRPIERAITGDKP